MTLGPDVIKAHFPDDGILGAEEIDLGTVICETDEGLEILCADLSLAKRWCIHAPENFGAADWKAMSKAVDRRINMV